MSTNEYEQPNVIETNYDSDDDFNPYESLKQKIIDIKKIIRFIKKKVYLKTNDICSLHFDYMKIEFLNFKIKEIELYLYSHGNIINQLKLLEEKIAELMVNFIEKTESMVQTEINESKFLDFCNKVQLLRSEYHTFHYINDKVYIKFPEKKYLYPKPDYL